MYSFDVIDFEQIEGRSFIDFPATSVFTTHEWIRFVQEDSKAEPLIVEIRLNEKTIGYFSALIMRKMGIKIIGSPFRGWSTCFMGFDVPHNNKIDILPHLVSYLNRTFRCWYIEIIDRDISVMQASQSCYMHDIVSTLELEIGKSDEKLFKVFKSDCRNFIRQFESRGASLEEAKPDDAFANEYYNHLVDVFRRQGVVPNYGVDKVRRLLSHLSNTGMLLCLRVRTGRRDGAGGAGGGPGGPPGRRAGRRRPPRS